VHRWSIFGLAGSLALVVSLYLPWQTVSTPSSASTSRFGGAGGGATAGLLNLFSGSANLSVDGWSPSVSGPAALSGLLLASLFAVGLVRPVLVNRLPIGLCGLFVGYFAFAVAAVARSNAHYRTVAYRQLGAFHFHYAYGAYIGVAGGMVALITVGGLRRNEILRGRSLVSLAAIVLAAGLLVSFLLPWERLTAIQRAAFLGVETPPAILAAVVIGATAVWWTSRSRAERFALTATAVLLISAAMSYVTLGVAHSYGAWVGLGLAPAFAALALVDRTSALERLPVSGQPRFGWHLTAVAGVVALFVVALFLPWQKVCFPTGSDVGPYAGRCLTTNGWVTILGTTAAMLSLLVAVAMLTARRLVLSAGELAVGTALFVATLGFELVPSDRTGLQLGYGAIVAFVATALLLVVVAARPSRARLEWRRPSVRVLPIAACVGYLALLVVPWWDVLPRRLQSESFIRFAPISWLTVASALLGIHLLGSWLRRSGERAPSATRLVLLPLALLALAALDLIRLRSAGITWVGGVVVVLCALLAVLGRIEARGGLENMRMPEILRFDRL
jgi:hypothetical protein